jgi:hypothetical protein
MSFDAEVPQLKHLSDSHRIQLTVCSHCNTCKILGGGAYTLNQIIPKDNLQITKGNLKTYTYTGDSGE